MPPRTRSKKEFSKDKDKIIDQAFKIIEKQGLGALSMRKLASKTGMSATNLYNYFYNKDELYLYILIRGFTLLDNQLNEALAQKEKPIDKLDCFLRVYIRFGLEQQGYYHLMMSTLDPKSMDYANSDLVDLAKFEKENAMKVFYRLEQILKDCLAEKEKDYFATSIRIICELHGVINLTHSNIIREIGSDTEQIIENLVESIILELG